MEHDGEARRGFGRMGFGFVLFIHAVLGCKHYRRRCRIRAPCCNDVFHCRHCHNESTVRPLLLSSTLWDQLLCFSCYLPSRVVLVPGPGDWIGSRMTGTSSTGTPSNRLTRSTIIAKIVASAGSCYSTTLRDKHYCIENSMKNNCPICYEYMFDSLRETSVLRCGHTMHLQCFHEMLKHDKFSCPICSTSIFDMDKFMRALDAEMEESYSYMGKGWIVCNDCRDTTQVYSGIAGHKCCHCQSYNTCRVAPPVLP
ncbi:hypothetical protein PR202_gb19865 [Eleusine coracana subsp. coracana]|uniref:Uncharacterized protein n=1 Tax=Eleusine coracana subsp. coracana TaxID=191504 RepID=A0AAV5FAT9_ELECO|nr:hypothetical protein PR202_gb19865 [Eleusine coracana subsp. coracana]